MRHTNHFRKLNRTSSHRQALLKNLSISLLTHEQITTTLPKAKELRPYIEKLITKARGSSLHVRRQLLAILQDDGLVTKLMTQLAERYKARNGGYTRIMKAGFRYGDCAPMAVIELVERDPSAKGTGATSTAKHTLEDAGISAPNEQSTENDSKSNTAEAGFPSDKGRKPRANKAKATASTQKAAAPKKVQARSSGRSSSKSK